MAAAQQTLEQLGIDANGAALSCALTYPFGVVGVIFAIVVLRRFFIKQSDLPRPDSKHKKNVFIASYRVTNPGVIGKTIEEVAGMSHYHFVISRMWHNGHVLIPMSDRRLLQDDIVLVITKPDEADALALVFGEQENKDWNSNDIDWNKIDSELISQRILVTRPEINGKKLSSLRLRNNYGINISRVYRSEVQLLATPDLVLQLGDRLTVVGEAADIKRVGGEFRVFAKGGREDTGMEAIGWIKRCVEMGAGEVVVNSIDTDGVKKGFDIEMLAAVRDAVKVPIVASGGAGCKDDFVNLWKTLPEISAGLAASIFHFGEVAIPDLKKTLKENGINVRL